MATTKSAQQSVNVEELVDRWFNDAIHNTAVSRDTDSYNLLFAAKEDLKQRLSIALKGD